VSCTYQPSPQNLLDRPHSPSLEQQAPQTGLQTKPVSPPQVPSAVTSPVCQGDRVTVVADWAVTRAGRSQKRETTFILNKGCMREQDDWWTKVIMAVLSRSRFCYERISYITLYCSQFGAVYDATHSLAYSERLSLRWTVSPYLDQVSSEDCVESGLKWHSM
jgi:hypothetical protein